MHWINRLLFWIFFGALCAFLAKKRNKNPLLWFFAGLLLGIIGVALILLLPLLERKKVPPPVKVSIPPPKQREYWNSFWYYLNPSRQQCGPIPYGELNKIWKSNEITKESYVWEEGMEKWKKIQELPELLQELTIE